MTIRITRTASLGLAVGTYRTFSSAVEAALVADREAVYDTQPASLAGPVTADAAGNLLANGQPLSPVSGAGSGPAVSLGVFSQSVPFGALLSEAQAPDAKQKVLFSAVGQGYVEGDYRNLAVGQYGSPLTLMIQKLAPECRVFLNHGGLGSISLSNEGTGVLDVTGWRTAYAYRGVKAADLANGDWGHKGEFALESGHWWEVWTGNDWLVTYNSDTPKVMASSVEPTTQWRRQLSRPIKNTSRTSSTAKPTFPATASPVITAITKANPAVVTYTGADPTNGDLRFLEGIVGMTELNGTMVTVANVNSGAKTFELSGVNSTNYTTYTSGGLVHYTVVDNGAGAAGGGLVWRRRTPGANSTADGSTNGAQPRSLRVMRTADPGWDPHGLLARLVAAILGAPVATANRYCLMVGTIQSDAGKDTNLVMRAMHLAGIYMATNNIKPIFTNCMFNPGSTQADYDTNETVLAGTGLSGTPNYASNPLKTAFDGSGYTYGVPGTTPRATNPQYFIIPSVYRTRGITVQADGLMQSSPDEVHPNRAGVQAWCDDLYPYVRRILLNVAA